MPLLDLATELQHLQINHGQHHGIQRLKPAAFKRVTGLNDD